MSSSPTFFYHEILWLMTMCSPLTSDVLSFSHHDQPSQSPCSPFNSFLDPPFHANTIIISSIPTTTTGMRNLNLISLWIPPPAHSVVQVPPTRWSGNQRLLIATPPSFDMSWTKLSRCDMKDLGCDFILHMHHLDLPLLWFNTNGRTTTFHQTHLL